MHGADSPSPSTPGGGDGRGGGRDLDHLAALGALAAAVAHHADAPLARVLGALDAIAALGARAGAGVPADPELDRAIAAARAGAERLRVLLEHLRALSALEAREAAMGPLDLVATVQSAALVAAAAVGDRARVVEELAPVPRVTARGDRMVQVFLDLILDAALAVPEGQAGARRITLRTAVAPGGRVVATVEDTGPAVALEAVPRLLDPVASARAAGQGRGLGLALCRRLVAEAGGELLVRRGEGGGAAVEVVLPAAGAPARPHRAAPPPARPGVRGRVLVVDDEEMLLKAITRSLGRQHEVVTVASAREALARVRAGEAFDVIVSDVLMPDMTGVELHEALAAERPDLAARLIFLTGGVFTQEARARLAGLPNLQLAKPFDRHRLLAIVTEAVARGTALPPEAGGGDHSG